MQQIKVDVTPGYEQSKIIYVSQYDVGREFKINLTDGTDGYTIPAGAVAKIKGTKPSTLGFTVQGTISGSSVTFTTTSDMTDETGRIPVEISLTKDSTILGSKNFYLEVEEATHHPYTPDGSKEFTIPELTLILQELTEATDRAEAQIDEMEDIAAAALNSKIAAQAAQEAAEEAARNAQSVFQVEGGISASVDPTTKKVTLYFTESE